MKEGAKGFDISHHQDVTYHEFVGAKQNGYEFVVIRATHGTDSVDTKFKRHYDAANKAGFVVFAYFFMYYADKEKSAREVANCLRTVKGLDLACVFLDMENRGEYFRGQHLSMLSKAEATERMLHAISEIEKAGFKAGLYADVDWMKNEIDMSRVPESVLIWAADWHGKLDYTGRCEMRQYTSVGSIAGVGSGSVDLDIMRVDWPPAKSSWTVSRVLSLRESRMIGTDVAYLQTALKMAGFNPGIIDGILGKKTDAAIRAFQTAKGLVVDGKAGPKTITALGGTWN